MEISYVNNKMEKILSDERLMKKYYTKDYRSIRNRLSQLISAENLEEIPNTPPSRRHKLEPKNKNIWAIDVSANTRIIFKPSGDCDSNDPKTIKKIEILDIEDYH